MDEEKNIFYNDILKDNTNLSLHEIESNQKNRINKNMNLINKGNKISYNNSNTQLINSGKIERTYLLKKRVPSNFLSDINNDNTKKNDFYCNNENNNFYNSNHISKFNSYMINEPNKIDEKTYNALSYRLYSDYNAKLEIYNGNLRLSINDHDLSKLKNGEFQEFNDFLNDGFELIEFVNEEENNRKNSDDNSDLDALSIDYGNPSEEENENYENDNEFSNSDEFYKDNEFFNNTNFNDKNLDNRINDYNGYFTKVVFKNENKNNYRDRNCNQESYYNDFYK